MPLGLASTEGLGLGAAVATDCLAEAEAVWLTLLARRATPWSNGLPDGGPAGRRHLQQARPERAAQQPEA